MSVCALACVCVCVCVFVCVCVNINRRNRSQLVFSGDALLAWLIQIAATSTTSEPSTASTANPPKATKPSTASQASSSSAVKARQWLVSTCGDRQGAEDAAAQLLSANVISLATAQLPTLEQVRPHKARFCTIWYVLVLFVSVSLVTARLSIESEPGCNRMNLNPCVLLSLSLSLSVCVCVMVQCARVDPASEYLLSHTAAPPLAGQPLNTAYWWNRPARPANQVRVCVYVCDCTCVCPARPANQVLCPSHPTTQHSAALQTPKTAYW